MSVTGRVNISTIKQNGIGSEFLSRPDVSVWFGSIFQIQGSNQVNHKKIR